MKLWLISQEVNRDYDTYDSAVVVAESEEDARHTNPSPEYHMWKDGKWCYSYRDMKPLGGGDNAWTDPKNVKVKLLGEADGSLKAGSAVCASYNAG